MNYSQFVSYLQNLLQEQSPSTSQGFTDILPAAIQDAEGRIYREIDFLKTRTSDNTLFFTPGNRGVTLPIEILVVQGVAAITPVATLADNGKRNALEPSSLDIIDYVWPTASITGLPRYWALKNERELRVAPTPDLAYGVYITGIIRPEAISEGNPTTYLGDIYPDLLVAATMIFLTGYQRDFGAQADNPQMAISWEKHYQDLKQSVMDEDQRRKTQSTNWSPMSPAPLSQNQRP